MTPKPPSRGWWTVLLAVRELDRKGKAISSPALSVQAVLPIPVASAWLSKFARWGYVEPVVVQQVESRKRWIRVYEITESGRTRPVPKKRMTFVPAPLPPRKGR